ncbi:hypothetical protein B7494_g8170 [Chlorociboria aeruginascens]|nr:hypothetical protein B7494_g8170 [Chlorociboria aeruginascens]
MADSSHIPTSEEGKDAQDPVAASVHVRRPAKLNKLYALPAPIRTFPLPTFIPHNPLSVFHILYVWLSQTIQQPQSHFEILYQGWYSSETRSIHVTDTRSINGLWQQGFYGKGNLSRSELNWLDREKARRGISAKLTSEDVTAQRRAERQQTKWERARKEREAIDQKLLEEADVALDDVIFNGDLIRPGNVPKDTGENNVVFVQVTRKFFSPVGPLELLSLPNSNLDLNSSSQYEDSLASISSAKASPIAPVGPLEILALPNSHVNFAELSTSNSPLVALTVGPITHTDPSPSDSSSDPAPYDHPLGLTNGPANSEILKDVAMNSILNGSTHFKGHPNGPALAATSSSTSKIKSQKSVRFSPTVEKTTFISSSPPNPSHSTASQIEEAPPPIPDKEHFQLTFEEAFFLSYALGSLTVLDPSTHAPFSNRQLFTLFQQSSHFPPTPNPPLSPDSPFLLSYIVYHHFRSLGWVVRAGIKFSVDYLLYNRGPPFSHAEFAILILPSYSAPYWSSTPFLEDYVRGKEKRTWPWLHCINRVITQVKKTLVLVYVDVPAPWDDSAENENGSIMNKHKAAEMPPPIAEILGRYKVREIVMQRWAANRSRD